MVLKFEYLKDLKNVNQLNISGVVGSKGSKQGRVGVYVTAVITYKTPSMVNRKPVTVSLALGEGVACNTICSWPFLKTVKASIMTNNNALVSVLLG